MGGGYGAAVADDRVFAKCAWRLLPLIMAAYVVNYIDRTNVGFAALTMNRDLPMCWQGGRLFDRFRQELRSI